MWVARNKDGSLHLWIKNPKPPTRQGDIWRFFSIDNGISIDNNLFPDLTWDNNPKEVFFNTGYNMADQINHVWAMLKCTQEELDKAHQTIQYYRTKFDLLKKTLDE